MKRVGYWHRAIRREALRIEPLLASGVAEHADFVASFEGYRKALAEHGARATLHGGTGRHGKLTRLGDTTAH